MFLLLHLIREASATPWISLEHPSLTGPGKELHTRNFRGNGTAT